MDEKEYDRTFANYTPCNNCGNYHQPTTTGDMRPYCKPRSDIPDIPDFADTVPRSELEAAQARIKKLEAREEIIKEAGHLILAYSQGEPASENLHHAHRIAWTLIKGEAIGGEA